MYKNKGHCQEKETIHVYALLIIHFIGNKHNFKIIKNKFKKSEDLTPEHKYSFLGIVI